jgi:hypothetical protein
VVELERSARYDGQALVRDGLLQEEALFRALLQQEQARDKRRLGEMLIAEGLLTEPQLLQTLRGNAEAQLYDLFLWADGRFEFDDETAPQPEATDLEIELKPVLEEGRHRRERWRELRARFGSNEVTFRLTADPVAVPDPLLRQVVDLAAWGKTLAGISLESRRSEYETTLLVAKLCDDGVLVPDHVESGAPETDPVGIINTLLAGAAMRLKEGRFDAANEAYERVLSLDGVNQAAKKGLIAVGAQPACAPRPPSAFRWTRSRACASRRSRSRSSASTRRKASCCRASTGSGTFSPYSSCARCPRTKS